MTDIKNDNIHLYETLDNVKEQLLNSVNECDE